jgi:hypothetical protein
MSISSEHEPGLSDNGEEQRAGETRLVHSPWPACIASLAFSVLFFALRDSLVMFDRGVTLAEAALEGGTGNISAFGRATAAATRGLLYYRFSAVCAVFFGLWAFRAKPRWVGVVALGAFLLAVVVGIVAEDFS